MMDVPYLSVQQLVDCDMIPNLGCIGGQALHAFAYVKRQGIAMASSYPYIDAQKQCAY